MLKNEMKDNQKLNGLQGQLGQMHNDFEDMKRTREEARKQLEAKFQDIYKKIQTLKEDLAAQSKRVNDSLKAFESKFTFLLNELKETLSKSIEEEKAFVREKFDAHEKKMESLEEMIKQEREERLKQTDVMLEPIRKELAELKAQQQKETKEREEGEKEIIRNINDNVYEINEKIKREKDDRDAKINILKEENSKEIKVRDQNFSDYQNKVANDLKVLKDEIYYEMENRFAHQNQIVDNISNFLKTFQDTLKVVGKDV